MRPRKLLLSKRPGLLDKPLVNKTSVLHCTSRIKPLILSRLFSLWNLTLLRYDNIWMTVAIYNNTFSPCYGIHSFPSFLPATSSSSFFVKRLLYFINNFKLLSHFYHTVMSWPNRCSWVVNTLYFPRFVGQSFFCSQLIFLICTFI